MPKTTKILERQSGASFINVVCFTALLCAFKGTLVTSDGDNARVKMFLTQILEGDNSRLCYCYSKEISGALKE